MKNKRGLILAGVFGGLILLGMAQSLLSNEPRAIGQATEIVTPPTAETTAETTVNLREQAWTEVRAEFQNLLSSADSIEAELRMSRAQRWLSHAAVECQRQNCKSPYSFLLETGKGKTAELQRIMLSGKISTDREASDEFRALKADILDISQALAISTNQTPVPFVLTKPLTQATDQFVRVATEFESIRQTEADKAYQEGETDGNP